MRQTHPVLRQHTRVPFRKVLAFLQMICTLYAVALLEVGLHDAGLHGAHPRLPDVVILLLLLSYQNTNNMSTLAVTIKGMRPHRGVQLSALRL